ncbi:MAG TPA: hypothetical protein VK837_05480 [Longimicrobiales bacterium]|nr:hypothetical protein [Longimicrobiales bacterium]
MNGKQQWPMRSGLGVAALVAAAVGVVACPAAAHGQTSDRWTLTPYATAVAPAGDYGRIADTSTGAASGVYAAVVGRLPAAAALGAAAEYRLGDSPFSVRASGAWSFIASGEVTLDCADQPCPAILVREELDTRVWTLTGGFAFRPDASLWSMRPLVTLGAGVRDRSFGWTGDDVVFPAGEADHRYAVFAGSVGATRPVGPGAIALAIGGWSGRVGGATDGYRHDVVVSLGYEF